MPQPIFFHSHFSTNAHQPKGAVIVMVAVLLIVLLGCVALAVDIGYLYVARTELQRTADAAAMAGVQALARNSEDPFGVHSPSAETVYARVVLYGKLNTVLSEGVEIDPQADVIIGYLANPHDLNAALQTAALSECNAVQVIARRDSSHANGRIKLFFGSIFGINSSSVGASAIAVLDDRFAGYYPQSVGGVPAIPIGVNAAFWKDQIEDGNGPDLWSYDSQNTIVEAVGDNRSEIQLFPEKLGPNSEEGEGAGNFTLLQIGSGSLGTSTLSDQIEHGISSEDIIDMTGEPMIKFFDDSVPVVYNAVGYDVAGDPGLKAGLKAALTEKIGHIVGFFIYDTIVNDGANAVFRITGMRFGRVMEVDLTGSDKILVIQPVAYYGPDIITSPNAIRTDWQIGSLQLVR